MKPLLLIMLFLFAGLTAAEEQTAAVSPASPQDKRIIERYQQILLRFPKRGVSFDEVFNSYSERNCIPLLLEYCIRQRETAKTPLAAANIEILLGLIYERTNERKKAVECFKRAAELDKTTPTAEFYLAENLLIFEKYNDAEQALKTALQRNPTRLEVPPLLRTFGIVLNKSKKYDEAVAVLQQVLKIEPDNFQTLALLAEGYAGLKRFDKASEKVQQLFGMKENLDEKQKIMPQLLEKLSEIAEEQNELQTAIQYQEQLCSNFRAKKYLNRLLTLYVKNEDKKKSYQLFFNLVLSADSVPEQTGYIVKMLAAGQFQQVEKILDFLEIHQEPNRQADFCRILLEYFRLL